MLVPCKLKEDRPVTQTLFSSLPLPQALLETIQALGYATMTPVQQQSLPLALAGQDLIAQARTGSGKTAAFAIALLNRLKVRDFHCQALVLCPTRELATQVAQEIRRLARYRHNIKVTTLCGGQPIGPQIGSLAHGTHVVVGTPGRIQDHLRKRTLSLTRVTTLVLDEADRMLDMGFKEVIDTILSHTPATRQTLLFSATFPSQINSLSRDIQRNPIRVTVADSAEQSPIEQRFYQVASEHKPQALIRLLSRYQPESAVIFCNTIQTCKTVGSWLYNQGLRAAVLHGDLEQKDRDRLLVRFANNSNRLLIATDVAARGLDIDALAAVINYDLSRDPQVHVHRIGRTGRKGRMGLALSLYDRREQYKLDAIGAQLSTELTCAAIEQLGEGKAARQRKQNGQACLAEAPMVTLAIDGGKKNKVRAGDILGALTGEAGIAASEVGKIDIFDFVAYVAIRRESARQALRQLEQGKIKGRRFKVRRV